MRYIASLGGERIEVELDAEGARVRGRRVAAHLADVDGTPVKLLTIGETVYGIVARRGEGRGQYHIWLNGFGYDIEALDERTRAIRDMSQAKAGAVGPAPVVAPMPGLIVRVNVQVGDRVEPGQGIVVMEAMKMENELRASAGGTVAAVRVQPGTAVEKGTVLVDLA